METYQHLDGNHPNNADERAAMVARLLDLIDRANAAIDFHQSFDEPDRLAISENRELRERYVRELTDLLHDFRIEGELRIREAA